MTVFELQDTLDQMKITKNDSKVLFKISKYDNTTLPQNLCEQEFSADIYEINLFAERYEKLDELNCAVFKSLLAAYPESSFEDLLLMTYGLDSVPVYRCSSLEELGEAMIENDMVEELKELPDEYIDFIDREKIGSLCQDREKGMFIAMPSKKAMDGEYRDIAHPINSDMRNMLESKVLAAYDAIEDEPAPETAE